MPTINLIYGVPGAGKTTFLIQKIQEEAQNVGIENIAYVSFSRKASYEGATRIGKTLGLSPDNKSFDNFRTIHSMCFRALKLIRSQVMDDKAYYEFGKASIFKIPRHLSTLTSLFEDDDAKLVQAYNLYRDNRQTFINAYPLINTSLFALFIKQYEDYKKTTNKVDFSDMLSQYVQQNIQQPVKVAFVDEAQDLSDKQWQVVMTAFKDCERIYIAGDDLQAIYTFIGSNTQAFLNLNTHNIYYLDYSHRCPKTVINKANNIASFIHTARQQKYIKTTEKTGDIYHINNLNELKDFKLSDSCLFLAINNSMLKQYESFLQDLGVPYNLKGQPILSNTLKQKIRDSHVEGLDFERQSYIARLIANGLFWLNSEWNVSTIHGAKGGEADNVILMDGLSKPWEHAYQFDTDAIHRIFYVAITRAKKNLYIVHNHKEYRYQYV